MGSNPCFKRSVTVFSDQQCLVASCICNTEDWNWAQWDDHVSMLIYLFIGRSRGFEVLNLLETWSRYL